MDLLSRFDIMRVSVHNPVTHLVDHISDFNGSYTSVERNHFRKKVPSINYRTKGPHKQKRQRFFSIISQWGKGPNTLQSNSV